MRQNQLNQQLLNIEDTDATIDVKLTYQAQLDELNQAINQLPTNEANCICMYYGIGMSIYDDYNKTTDRYIAEVMGITTARANKIRHNALHHLHQLAPKTFSKLERN